MVGDSIYILFTEIIEDGCTVRQTVEAFEKQEDAREELERCAQDETVRCGKQHPDWKMATGSADYFECCNDDDLHNNHSTAKIVLSIVK